MVVQQPSENNGVNPSLTLLDLLSNSIIRDTTYPHLPLATMFALLAVSRAFRELVMKDPQAFRYVDLSQCRGAYISPSITRIDSGGHSWRAERMDENLTEDEFYAGPLRGIFTKLDRLRLLTQVYTLILDGLLSVTHDLVSELVQNVNYNIRVLSVRDCPNLNQRKMQQLLCYICRPSRPEGTPKLRGLYIFGVATPSGKAEASELEPSGGSGVTQSDGAQLGAAPRRKAAQISSTEVPAWYMPAGDILKGMVTHRQTWNETLQVCKGIIAFDAVLCSAMHRALSSYLHEGSKDHLRKNYSTIAPVAAIALGPDGCQGCGLCPDDTPVWGESALFEFPLLSPPPYSGKIVDALRPPKQLYSTRTGQELPRRLVVSCSWCLTNRYCEKCHRWWCGDCFDPKRVPAGLENDIVVRDQGEGYFVDTFNLDTLAPAPSAGSAIKVYNNLCVEHCLVPEMMVGAGSGGMWG